MVSRGLGRKLGFRPVAAISGTLLLAVVVLAGSSLAFAAQSAKDTVVVAQGTDVENLDPHQVASTPTAIVTEHIYDTLVTFDQNFKVIPRLATAWKVSSDGLEWTFTLRPNVKFTDGTPFDADVVKWNIERLLDPSTNVPLRSYISMVKQVEVINKNTVKIILKYPHAPFLQRLTAACNAMVSPAAVKKWGKDYPLHPVGTGAYKLAQWTKGDKLILERNEDYWGEKPPIRRIIFRPVPDDNARVMMLEAGDADVIVRVPPVEVKRLEKQADLRVVNAPSTREVYIVLNNTWGPLKDVRVRQALNYAVNKEEIVRNILLGAGRAVDSPVLPEMFGYKSVGDYEYNPQKAKELLAKAGYPNGFSATLYATEGRYLMDKMIAQAIQGYLAQVGVSVEIRTMEWATYLAFVRRPVEESKTQMFMIGWGPWLLDGDQMLYPLFRSDQWPPAGSNYGFYKNADVDRYLQIGTSSTDDDERAEAYAKAQGLIMKDAPWILLHGERQLIAMRKDLKGVLVLPIEQLRFQQAYFAK